MQMTKSRGPNLRNSMNCNGDNLMGFKSDDERGKSDDGGGGGDDIDGQIDIMVHQCVHASR